MRPVSTETPPPLPADLPAQLAAEHKIVLFLDYDGTLSEITPDIANAQPVAGAGALIKRLAASPDRFRVVVVSGRQIDKLRRLLDVPDGVTLVGTHGIEIIEPGGKSATTVDPETFMPALQAVKEWLRTNIPNGEGFVIEDKPYSVALHYRLARPDAALTARLRLREFAGRQTPSLELREGKMVIEALPHGVNKGEALRMILNEGGEDRLPIYFGDDITDEDAFFALRETKGLTVKVSAEPAPSWAMYRVATPADVIIVLAGMAASSGTRTT